jgi:hypothetical protein
LVVAGIAAHEDAVRPLAGAVNKMLGSFVGVRAAKAMEIHGSPMLRGRGEWKAVGAGKRHALAFGLLDLINEWHHKPTDTLVEVFVVAMDRDHSQSPFETAYGELLYLFDGFLREGRRRGNPHNGILIADRGKYQRTLEAWVELARGRYKRPRQDERRLYALAETPFFIDSRSTRLMQLADLVAHSFFRAYNSNDWTRAEKLLPSVTDPDNVRLLHFTSDPVCTCPVCASSVAAEAEVAAGQK